MKGPFKILVVDDQWELLIPYLGALDSKRFAYDTARNIAEACALTESARFHIALVDIGLGAENGLDLVEPLDRKGTLVVMLSGQTDFKAKAARKGATLFIDKKDLPDLPIKIESFGHVVEKLERERARAERAESRLEVGADRALEMIAARTCRPTVLVNLGLRKYAQASNTAVADVCRMVVMGEMHVREIAMTMNRLEAEPVITDLIKAEEAKNAKAQAERRALPSWKSFVARVRDTPLPGGESEPLPPQS